MPPDLDAVRAGAVTLWRARYNQSTWYDAHVPRRDDSVAEEIKGLPSAEFDALLDALAAARDLLDALGVHLLAMGENDPVRERVRALRAALAKIGGA